jgi:uncharacterized peroxidase-related enzyme
MARIRPIDPDRASPEARDLLAGIEAELGFVPNVARTLAHSPKALAGVVQLDRALRRGAVDDMLRERIALAVAQENACCYCLAAHMAMGRAVGLTDEELSDSRRCTAPDGRTGAALTFVRSLVRNRGKVDDRELERLREVGFDDAGITELVALTAYYTFTNYLTHVAETPLDFPRAGDLPPE